MIKYKLICKSCNKSYDSWFSSSKEYEKLKKLKHINCYSCGSLNVEKTLMSAEKNDFVPFKNLGTDSSTLAEHITCVLPNFIMHEPSA